MRLLQSGYSVNTTINNNLDPEGARFLEKLPNASQKLKIYITNPEDPKSFEPDILNTKFLLFLKVAKAFKFPRLSSKKLLDSGFKYKYNLEDMYDGAIASCKRVGLL
ncbi:hypothetical protein HAX54_031756 [Datura stramonium]|uniref:Uncharacterized protein n=1 Tax=Datura stramonium TaxID=4076 RepID=A0ABS8VBK9_DATST|nr:hypothetical protein [Datura stramonium]